MQLLKKIVSLQNGLARGYDNKLKNKPVFNSTMRWIALLKVSIILACVLMFTSVATIAQNITATPYPANGSEVSDSGIIEITFDRNVTVSFCAESVLVNGFSTFTDFSQGVFRIFYDDFYWKGTDTLRIEISDNAIFETANTSNRSPLSLYFVRPGSSSVKELGPTDKILIHPNPVSDVLHIEAENLKRIEIIDVSGRVLIQRIPQRSDRQQIDLSRLREGIYFVRLTTTDNQVMVERFVKK